MHGSAAGGPAEEEHGPFVTVDIIPSGGPPFVVTESGLGDIGDGDIVEAGFLRREIDGPCEGSVVPGFVAAIPEFCAGLGGCDPGEQCDEGWEGDGTALRG